jgi:hypothetical protein
MLSSRISWTVIRLIMRTAVACARYIPVYAKLTDGSGNVSKTAFLQRMTLGSSLLVWINHLRSDVSGSFRLETAYLGTSLRCPMEKRAPQTCLRRARRMNMMAMSDPSTAPINAPVTEASWRDRTPLPANRKLPQYASAMVQTIMRMRIMGAHLSVARRSYQEVPKLSAARSPSTPTQSCPPLRG